MGKTLKTFQNSFHQVLSIWIVGQQKAKEVKAQQIQHIQVFVEVIHDQFTHLVNQRKYYFYYEKPYIRISKESVSSLNTRGPCNTLLLQLQLLLIYLSKLISTCLSSTLCFSTLFLAQNLNLIFGVVMCTVICEIHRVAFFFKPASSILSFCYFKTTVTTKSEERVSLGINVNVYKFTVLWKYKYAF